MVVMRGTVRGDEYTIHRLRSSPVDELVPAKARLAGTVAGWLARRIFRGARWAVRHPVFVAFTFVVVALSTSGLLALLAGVAVAVVVLVGWRLRWPTGFRRHIVARLRGSIRAGLRYRPRWQSATEALALGVGLAGRRYLPRLVKVRSMGAVDVVTAKLLPGQTVAEWTQRGDHFAATFGALDCRITTNSRRRGLVDLRFLARDPFAVPVAPFPQTGRVNLDAVPVALAEDGTRYRLPLRGNHFLLGGQPGAGKSGAIQALIDALAPAVHAGLVCLHGIDMKGGIELANTDPLFTTFEHRNIEMAADALERLVRIMDARLAAMFGNSRLHTPTTDEPLHVIIIDELAALTAYVTDSGLKKRLATSLQLLLSQGRAPGVVVVGGVQDIRKETVPMRDLFTYRIAFRLPEAQTVSMILSKGARDRGARCDEIPPTTPGVAYVEVDDQAEPVRVRFPHITDERIAATVQKWTPPEVAPVEADSDTDVDVDALASVTGNEQEGKPA